MTIRKCNHDDVVVPDTGWGDSYRESHVHEVGKCDICHKDFKFLEQIHGYFYGVNMITRYCEECWRKEEEVEL